MNKYQQYQQIWTNNYQQKQISTNINKYEQININKTNINKYEQLT